MYSCVIESPVGELHLREEEGFLTQLCFSAGQSIPKESHLSPLLREAAAQLEAYFSGRLKNFDLPLRTEGTPFMREVWSALTRIPYGVTATYKEIAQCAGNPLACRAVGQANHRNPLAIVIPCHRVIGSNRRLVGYAGGLAVKKFLLRLEGATTAEA